MRKLNLPVAVLKADGAHIGDLHIPANLITPNVGVESVAEGMQVLSLEIVVSRVDFQSWEYELSNTSNPLHRVTPSPLCGPSWAAFAHMASAAPTHQTKRKNQP